MQMFPHLCKQLDILNQKQRSYCMSQIKAKDTKAEVILRSLLWKKGFRGYRIHARKITGNPDIYFPGNKLAVFIDGCFWHKCPKCFVKPKNNSHFWENKIQSNVARDKKVNNKLRKEGIKVLRFWEHEMEKRPASCLYKVISNLHQ